MNNRKNYLDNIRWITVVLVIIYHIIYLFNNSGVISNIDVKGVPIMDSFLIFVYPWFMCLLFIVSGISIRYSLEKRTNKEFIKDRKTRILIPSIIGIFAYGWISGLITNQYVDIFGGNGNMIPNFIKYLIYCLMGIGPLWYCHILFVGSLLIVLIRKLDKKDRISNICKKVNLPILFFLVFVVWGSSYILNASLVKVYRFGIYLLMILLGYYVFYNQDIIKKLEKISVPLCIISLITGVFYVIKYYGVNYSDDIVLQSFFTNFYLWITILAVLGISSRYLNFKNKFTEYMIENNFGIYVFHYTVVLLLGYLAVTYLKLPFVWYYVIILIGTVFVLPLIVEIVKRIPIINKLLLGKSSKKIK